MLIAGLDPNMPQIAMPQNLETFYNENGIETMGLPGVASVSTDPLPDVTQLYLDNKEWAEEQAQKQMDYQTNANAIAMQFSADQAAIQRAYETEMSNTAYQRVVEDLKKAGLNPALAYQQGAAHVPSVSAASGVSSSGAIATMADTGYGSYELKSREKVALIAATSKVISSLINAVK